MKLHIEATENLKESLVSKGFLFPCGGKGICGRCRIIAPLLPETALDQRFLSDYERANGMRLACDKRVDTAMEIDCLLQKGNAKKAEDPSVTVVLDDTAVILLTDGTEEADRIVLPLPDHASGREILAAIQKNSIELYEKHGVAKAVTLGIFGTEKRMRTLFPELDHTVGASYDAAELSLPSEEGYLAPSTAACGQLLAAAIKTEAPVAMVLADRALFLSPDMPLFAELRFPIGCPAAEKSLFSDAAMERLNADGIWQVFGAPLPISHKHTADGDLALICAEVQSARKYRTKLNRLASALTELPLAEDDEFQSILTGLTKENRE